MGIRASVIELEGKRGTYTSHLGGRGLGYLWHGKVYSSGGNGFYYPVHEPRDFRADDGEAYLAAVERLALPPAYKRSKGAA